ncbi:hypothetical protein [Nostoc sp.]|uniref:hypothetical protein n=1 Tax=Nostoc sp. TaxID=1180 RepID=UPI002FF9A1AB
MRVDGICEAWATKVRSHFLGYWESAIAFVMLGKCDRIYWVDGLVRSHLLGLMGKCDRLCDVGEVRSHLLGFGNCAIAFIDC